MTGVSVTFPDLNAVTLRLANDFQTNLIMPEPCPFLSRKLPPCSVIRPTETKDIAKGVVEVPDRHGPLHRPVRQRSSRC